MARFIVWDIKWNVPSDSKPNHTIVWLPGYMAGVPEDDAEAVLEKIEADFGGYPADYKLAVLDHLDQDGNRDEDLEESDEWDK